MTEAKPFTISKELVYQAWRSVKANKGAAGIDGQSLADFETHLGKNLYKIWNQNVIGQLLSSPRHACSHRQERWRHEAAGALVEKTTVADRVAQTVVKLIVEPLVEPVFHENSYGYRPNRSAHQALALARKRCWRHS